jgi:hypothetical protein
MSQSIKDSGSIISDKISQFETQKDSFEVLRQIKEGEKEGVDTRPDLTAQDCAQKVSRLKVQLKRLKS